MVRSNISKIINIIGRVHVPFISSSFFMTKHFLLSCKSCLPDHVSILKIRSKEERLGRGILSRWNFWEKLSNNDLSRTLNIAFSLDESWKGWKRETESVFCAISDSTGHVSQDRIPEVRHQNSNYLYVFSRIFESGMSIFLNLILEILSSLMRS